MPLPPPFDITVSRDHDLPVGTQLAWRLQGLILEGRLAPGERLPSVRALAEAAGVNVNTVRAVYGRLEERGLVVSEQGRGTFVAAVVHAGGESRTRDRLRAEIAQLEAELARRPQPPAAGEPAPPRSPPSRLLSADELAEVRDALVARLTELDAARQQVLQELEELRRKGPRRAGEPTRQSSSAAGRVRLRWIPGG